MMRRRYGEWILGMFAAGVILGTAAVNLGGEDFREQAGGMAEALFAGAQASRGAFWELLRMTALCRAGETALLWAAGFLGAGRMLCCLLAGCAGACGGAVLSVFTWEFGAAGPAFYLATLFPHFLFYLPLWLFLVGSAGHRGRIPGRYLAAGFLLLGAGIFCETAVNPGILLFFSR